MTRTYLDKCLKNGRVVRWPDKAFPIKVYIAPFNWYEKSKQAQSPFYQRMVLETMDTWAKASGNMVKFQLVQNLQDSQIDLNWRRVDRSSLGHCEYLVNKQGMIYSAEIRIGISDGLLHTQYNDTGEVRHTIMHEFGHALGLIGHSDADGDIMYVPHQYGVTEISPRDKETLRWLYKLPVGFDYIQAGKNKGLPEPFTLHDIIERMAGGSIRPREAPAPPPSRPRHEEKPEVLMDQHQILSEMGKFHMSTQNIQLNPETRKSLLQKRFDKSDPL